MNKKLKQTILTGTVCLMLMVSGCSILNPGGSSVYVGPITDNTHSNQVVSPSWTNHVDHSDK